MAEGSPASIWMFALLTLLIFLFAVTMGVYHGKAKNDDETENQHDDHRLKFPDLANKFG